MWELYRTFRPSISGTPLAASILIHQVSASCWLLDVAFDVQMIVDSKTERSTSVCRLESGTSGSRLPQRRPNPHPSLSKRFPPSRHTNSLQQEQRDLRRGRERAGHPPPHVQHFPLWALRPIRGRRSQLPRHVWNPKSQSQTPTHAPNAAGGADKVLANPRRTIPN
jgi:hypothetical protein